jgi:hypothetical protein
MGKPVILHTHQYPATAKPLTVQSELQITSFHGFRRCLLALRLPITTVPQLYRPAAVLALGNRAFKVSVVQRMVFDLDG